MEDVVDDSWKIQADLGRTQGKSGGGKTDFQYCTSFIPWKIQKDPGEIVSGPTETSILPLYIYLFHFIINLLLHLFFIINK
jgi:hypothetical protein